MSQSWLSKRRERAADWDGPTGSEPQMSSEAAAFPEAFEDETEPPRRNGWAIFGRLLLGLVAGAWLGISIWSFVDPTVGMRLAPVLEVIIRLSAPLVLLVGLAILFMMIAGSWGGDDQEEAPTRSNVHELNDSAARTAQSAARITEAHNQLLSETKAYATAADRSANALVEAVNAMAAQSDRLTENTNASLAALTAIDERMTAVEASAPQIEARLIALTEALARLGIELGERSSTLEAQLSGAATAAQNTRSHLVEASESLSTRIEELRAGTQAAGEELTSLSELSSARIDLTLERVKSVLEATEKRIETHNGNLAHMVERHQGAIDSVAQQSAERFLAQCGEMERVLATLGDRIDTQSEKSARWLEGTDERIAGLTSQFDALEQSAIERTEQLAVAMRALTDETHQMTDALSAGDQSSAQLIQRAEALLLVLDSGIRELDESLPGAIGRVEARLSAMKQRIAEATPEIEGVEAVAAAVVSRMDESDKVVRAQAGTLDAALTRSKDALATQAAQIEALAEAVSRAGDGMAQLGERTGPLMSEAMERVREAAETAAERARDAIASVIPQSAEQLGRASGKAVEQAVAATVSTQIDRLAEVADSAVTAAQTAAGSLDEQIKALTQSSETLERRLAKTKEEVEAQDRELLTRRSADLIETLNSRAIDVAKWLGQDITQGEWSAYLSGDQSLFARKAVRLLDRSDARALRELYAQDGDFSDNVNRYIHDFEALLKHVLDAKEGSALAVTMLSSDLGKLYVALAQGIERLRTK